MRADATCDSANSMVELTWNRKLRMDSWQTLCVDQPAGIVQGALRGIEQLESSCWAKQRGEGGEEEGKRGKNSQVCRLDARSDSSAV